MTTDTADAILDKYGLERGPRAKQYGVKGMRWGVKRSRAQIDAASEDATKAGEIRTKVKRSGTSAASNAELQTLVKRMQLEQQYSDLAAKRSTKSKGRQFIEKTARREIEGVIAGNPGPIGKAIQEARTPGKPGRHRKN